MDIFLGAEMKCVMHQLAPRVIAEGALSLVQAIK